MSTEAVGEEKGEESEDSSSSSDGRLTLSSTQHHTLPRSHSFHTCRKLCNKTPPSQCIQLDIHTNLSRMRREDQKMEEARPRSQGELPGSLVIQAPNFVTSIAVVSRLKQFFNHTLRSCLSRSGSLLSLTSLDSCLSSSASSTARVEARNHRLHASTAR